MTDIKEDIIKIISSFYVERGYEDGIIENMELEMSSLIFIEIVIEIEEYFNIVIPDEVLTIEQFNRIDKIICIVENELNDAKAGGYEDGDTK